MDSDNSASDPVESFSRWVSGTASQALEFLREPNEYRPLGMAGAKMVRERYSLDQCPPKLAEFYRQVGQRKSFYLASA